MIGSASLAWAVFVIALLIPQTSWSAEPPLAEEPFPETSVIAELKARQEKAHKDNPPMVIRLPGGTQVQPTPDDPIAYNTYFLDADNRGCRSCHPDLRKLLGAMPYVHIDTGPMFGIDLSVNHCVGCHTYSPNLIKEQNGFGRLIHSIHRKNKGFSGDCASCHDFAGKDGKFRLWEQVKYELLRGIIDLPKAGGEFSFDQKIVTKDEDLFSLFWLYDKNDYLRYASRITGKELSGDTFDNWIISVTGEVKNPYRISLPGLIAAAPVENVVMKMHCTMNPPGAGLIENVKITGIPLDFVLAKAGGVKPGATAVFPADSGGYSYPAALDHLKNHKAYLAYEFNGKRLSTVHGYPVQIWIEGMGAQAFVKQLSEIRVSKEPIEGMHLYRGWEKENGGFFNKPNMAIFYTKAGQVIPAGKPFTFEGYADAFDEAITSIEISMDRCKTWTKHATPGATPDRWLYWYYTFTPPERGAYVICMRAITEKGLVSDMPVMLMVNAR